MRKELILIVALLFFVNQEIKAQDSNTQTLLGNVKNSKNEPVIGATVFLDTLKTNVLTNGRGYFQVEVPKEVKKVYILSEEYGILAVNYSGEKSLNFMYLINDRTAEIENELIDMGYGKVLNKNTTGSTSQIEYKDPTRNPGFANIYEMISGRIPGVQVVGGNKIIIRGLKTLTSDSDPLFVVDGTVRNNIDDIPPNQVKSISVLKDASAAVYGSRGANGVILINLK